jgi:hypothetical protein
MKRLLERAWLRWCYSWEMANAYLAANMGEVDVAANHESAARQAERRLIVLGIQS